MIGLCHYCALRCRSTATYGPINPTTVQLNVQHPDRRLMQAAAFTLGSPTAKSDLHPIVLTLSSCSVRIFYKGG
jgi:hypothetical protein